MATKKILSIFIITILILNLFISSMLTISANVFQENNNSIEVLNSNVNTNTSNIKPDRNNVDSNNEPLKNPKNPKVIDSFSAVIMILSSISIGFLIFFIERRAKKIKNDKTM